MATGVVICGRTIASNVPFQSSGLHPGESVECELGRGSFRPYQFQPISANG